MHPTVRAIRKVMPSIICWLSEASSFWFPLLPGPRLCGQHLRLPSATTGPSRSRSWSRWWSRRWSRRRSPGAATSWVWWGRLMREMCVTQRQLSNDKRIEASAGLHWRPEHAQALYSELNQMLLPAQLFQARNKLYWLYMRSSFCHTFNKEICTSCKKERGRGREWDGG